MSPSSPPLPSTSYHSYHSSSSDVLISCHDGQGHLPFSSSTELELQLLFLKEIKKYSSRQDIITISKAGRTNSLFWVQRSVVKKEKVQHNLSIYLDIPLTVSGKDVKDQALQLYLRSDSRA